MKFEQILIFLNNFISFFKEIFFLFIYFFKFFKKNYFFKWKISSYSDSYWFLYSNKKFTFLMKYV